MPFAVSAVIFQFPFFIRLFALRGHKYRWRLKVYFKYLLQSFFLPQPSRHTIYVFIHLSPHTHASAYVFTSRYVLLAMVCERKFWMALYRLFGRMAYSYLCWTSHRLAKTTPRSIPFISANIICVTNPFTVLPLPLLPFGQWWIVWRGHVRTQSRDVHTHKYRNKMKCESLGYFIFKKFLI